jgi:hypothetical protein
MLGIVKLLFELRRFTFKSLACGDGRLRMCDRLAKLVSHLGFFHFELTYQLRRIVFLLILLRAKPFDLLL